MTQSLEAAVCVLADGDALEAFCDSVDLLLAHAPHDRIELRCACSGADFSADYALGTLCPDNPWPAQHRLPGEVERMGVAAVVGLRLRRWKAPRRDRRNLLRAPDGDDTLSLTEAGSYNTAPYDLTQSAMTTEPKTVQENGNTGAYSNSASDMVDTTRTENTSLGTSSAFLTQTVDTTDNSAAPGNELAGCYTSTTTATATTTVSAAMYGNTSDDEAETDTSTTLETGNTLTGAVTQSVTGTTTVTETITVSATTPVTLAESSTQTYTQAETGNTLTGDYTQTITAVESYGATETVGSSSGGMGTMGSGTDYTMTETGNTTTTTTETGNQLTEWH